MYFFFFDGSWTKNVLNERSVAVLRNMHNSYGTKYNYNYKLSMKLQNLKLINCIIGT